MKINPVPRINPKPPVYREEIRFNNSTKPYQENKIYMILPGTEKFRFYDFVGRLKEMRVIIPKKNLVNILV